LKTAQAGALKGVVEPAGLTLEEFAEAL